jgi:hypothetical protein
MTAEQKGPGPTSPQEWKISDHDRAVIERAVGAAVIDKLRGQKASLVDMYRLHGGTDPGTEQVLTSYEDALQALDGHRHQHVIGGHWQTKFSEWNLSQRELTLLARAIGAARLARAEGAGASTAREHYERIGGTNPSTLEALERVARA